MKPRRPTRQVLLVDQPAMRGYRRMGRARLRVLRQHRLVVDPPLSVVDHDAEPQPPMRAARAAYLQDRRGRRFPGHPPVETGALDLDELRLSDDIAAELNRAAGRAIDAQLGIAR